MNIDKNIEYDDDDDSDWKAFVQVTCRQGGVLINPWASSPWTNMIAQGKRSSRVWKKYKKNISQIVSKYKLMEKDQVGFGRRVQLQFKYKYFLVFIFIYVHIYVDICFICKEINKEFLLCCCWYMVWLYMGRNLGKSPKMFWLSRCPGKDF